MMTSNEAKHICSIPSISQVACQTFHQIRQIFTKGQFGIPGEEKYKTQINKVHLT